MDDTVREALMLLGLVYFVPGFLIFFLAARQRGNIEKSWRRYALLPFLPVVFFWMVILVLISLPYFWLYPERHMTRIDFEGTPEDKLQLRAYRNHLSGKGLVRRLAENIGIVSKKQALPRSFLKNDMPS